MKAQYSKERFIEIAERWKKYLRENSSKAIQQINKVRRDKTN